MVKEMAKAKKMAEETEHRLAVEQQMREKEKLKKEKAAMLEQLRRDKEERFGKKFAGTGGEAAAVETKPKLTPMEQLKHSIKTVNTLYTQDTNPGVAKTCFKTFVTFCKNVLKDPSEPKFRKINLDNENV